MRPEREHTPNGKTTPEVTAAAVLEMVQQLVRELRPTAADGVAVTLDSSLERELGFDSLSRVELLERLERAFGVRLTEQLLATAETPRDLLRAMHQAEARSPASATASDKPQTLEAVETLPTQARTLVDVLAWHTHAHPQRPHISFYNEAGTVEEITYAALYEEATAVAAGLRQRGLQPQQTVALMLPTSRAFFAGFYGILLAGGIPVPIYPPTRPSQLEDHLRRQAGILTNAQATMLITVPEARALARLLRAQVETLRHVLTVAELAMAKEEETRPVVQEHDLAFLQYTSGSTGNPKGVMLTHANLLANIRAMTQSAHVSSQDVFVSWLPLYHDMGLIGAWLGSLYHAFHLVLMSPLTFLARPERWLWAIHTHGGTISGGPNFGYELCLRRIDDRDLEGLNLSSWRLAFNGAEPVSPETIRHFCARFAPYGFRPEAMTPVYGLAEGSLGLAFSPPGRGVHIDRIKREPFLRAGRAIPAAQNDTETLAFVACGQPLLGHQLRIVDASGYEVPERQAGRLEFCGPSATRGYFRNPEATRQLFRGTWLDSGDLAYIAAGEVYITGREKDLIIRAGRNLYPHELEEAVGNIPGIRKGCVAVFGTTTPVSETERLVVLAETRESDKESLADLRRQIDALAVELIGTPPDDIVLAPPHTVLKTSSGKIRRSASRERYERGDIGKGHTAVWRQVARLAVAGVLPQLRRYGCTLTTLGYTAYAWAMFAGLGIPAWFLIAILPRRSWCQTAARTVTRLMLRLAGIPLRVQGLEQLQREQSSILVTNHASYVDVVALMAALPGDVSYVAKRELDAHWITRVILRRLGTVFVERFEMQRSVEDTEQVLQVVQQGRVVVFFPEGTFGREPGLRPFRMGAFVVAAQAGVPVIPVAIRGTRSILRAGQWLLHRGPVRITIGEPCVPRGTNWSAAIELRATTRAFILQYCGEPSLDTPADPGAFAPSG
jgi:1-acyl-sn-glycerol-3-phosphate acyltransferase